MTTTTTAAVKRQTVASLSAEIAELRALLSQLVSASAPVAAAVPAVPAAATAPVTPAAVTPQPVKPAISSFLAKDSGRPVVRIPVAWIDLGQLAKGSAASLDIAQRMRAEHPQSFGYLSDSGRFSPFRNVPRFSPAGDGFVKVQLSQTKVGEAECAALRESFVRFATASGVLKVQG